jgi:hypothetical protein
MSNNSTASALETEPETEPKTDSDDPEQHDTDPVFDSVSECRQAYCDAHHKWEKKLGGPAKPTKYLCQEHAREAYRNALPVFSNRQNILAFMSCVAEGVLIEAIPEKTGSKLIYAAQAALGAPPREPKPDGKHTPPPPPGCSESK